MGSLFPIRRSHVCLGSMLGLSRRGDLSSPVLVLLAAAVMCTGCQSARPIASRQLIEHQAVIDFSGLTPAQALQPLKSIGAVPRTWEQVGPIKNALYTHTQW